MKIAAAYLPGLKAEELAWHTLIFGEGGQRLEVSVPQLTPGQLQALARHVRTQGGAQIRALSVSQIIAAVDRAIARLLDAQDPYRQQLDQLLPRITGFDAEMVRLGLNAYLKTFRAPQLQRFVAEDFANPKLLDEFQPRVKGGMARALGPELLVHVWAGNVPGLPLWSLVCGLLVKAPAVGKVASAEPLFAALFARLLAEVEPKLADALAIVSFKGGDTESERALYAEADTVLAYGGNETLAALRQQLPVSTRFLPHGHKLSVGLVSAAALDAQHLPAVARAAALDVVRYEQQGCYSPHTYYVARGGRVSPREFAQALAGELSALQHKFARRALSLEEAAGVAGWRQGQELQGQDGSVELIGDASAPWAVAYAEQAGPLLPCALNRTVQVQAVAVLDETLPPLAAQRDYLQTVGIAAAPQELHALAEGLGRAGATRICALGQMTAPEAGWHHDGRFSLLDLVRMVELEQSAEDAAEQHAAYRD
ncbi:MAG: acyl-CoA reductase [Hylemonella sp.]|uniref:acyl-CoA reductase n=1 Tax=Hylemonella sp. TaxID=2066020 RepID=UPI0022C29EB8|nr:acyl-CoA reductase [Hylemonella sp.]MCZ8252087.1 acyl-CoA reductase [Hylemonella sp.]